MKSPQQEWASRSSTTLAACAVMRGTEHNARMEEILSRLGEIEKEEKVTIFYACESGSRAWGFPSKDIATSGGQQVNVAK